MDDIVDLCVIGAGPMGLAVAKTYHEVHPEARLVILDDSSTVGGTWSKERLYQDLNTNNLLGTYEYPDFPMTEGRYGVTKGKTVSGLIVHQYFVDYAKHFGIFDLVRCNTMVVAIQENGASGWTIRTRPSKSELTGGLQDSHILARRLVVASGLTSLPNMPVIPGASDFEGELFHVKDFAKHAAGIDDEPSSRIVIIGGAKSAYDAVYSHASRGHKIDWIIRPGGRGPAWMSPPYVTPFRLWLEQIVSTRLTTWLVPCMWESADGFAWPRWFLHRTWLGKMVVRVFGNVMDSDILGLVGYNKHKRTESLKPWFKSLEVGANLSILTYPTDVFQYVRDGTVTVHIANVEYLSKDSAHLSTGEKIATKKILCATGWRFVPKFLEGMEEELGLPHSSHQADKLGEEADRTILATYPQLARHEYYGPKRGCDIAGVLQTQGKDTKTTLNVRSYRLHRFLVPLKHIPTRTIAFASATYSLRTLVQAHIQGLWITAFFDGDLKSRHDLRSHEELEAETVLYAHSGRWTSPGGYSRTVPDLVFQHLPFLDLLLSDLGIESWRKLAESRKDGGWSGRFVGRLREIFEPYMPSDYRHVLDEWKAQRSSRAQ